MKYIKEHFQLFMTCLICFFIVFLLFYIFIGSKSWMNQDSAFFVDYAIEVIESNSLFPGTWYNSNDFWVYSLVPLISIFIKMGVNLFLSRQLSVFIQSIVLFLLLYDLFHNIMKDHEGFKIVVLMLLSGISGQFIFEVFGDASYGTIILFMLAGIWAYIKYKNESNKKYLILLYLLLIVLTSCSLRFPIYLGAPIICSIIYEMYEKGIKKENVSILSLCICSIFLGFLLNIFLRSNYLFVSNIEGTNLVSGGEVLEYNVFNFIYNFLFVSGATRLNIYSLNVFLDNNFISSSSSPLIIVSFIKLIFALSLVVTPFMLVKKIKKMNSDEKTLYIFITSFLFIILFFIIMGSMQWYRYVTIMIFFILLLYPIIYKYYFKKELRNQFVFYALILLFVGSSFFLSIYSYMNLSKLRVRENNYQKIVDFVESKGLSFGYTIRNNESNIYRLISNGSVEVVALSNNGKEQSKWLASTKWIKEGYHNGKVFFIRTKNQNSIDFEKDAIEKYELSCFDDFVIFVFKDNKSILNYIKGDSYEKEQ